MKATIPPPAPPASGRGVAEAALKGFCPGCGTKSLFDGIVRFAPRCRACGLDYSSFNVGDGPAAFLILIVGGLVTGLAITLELAAAPPLWLHLLLWPLVTLAAVLGLLRLAKAALLTLEYRHKAREGRISD
ncbi:DUF983 domain-containing protein [Sphingosinicella humi]|uniref:DUF983 domain-containing protein n=1 Tax=Allosphingosinicella humi TaxID=2068657 RepID=A0A2U2J2X2_9SPHN|nr:hypothetical protein DF286_07145 [Sphingosinicella humi]